MNKRKLVSYGLASIALAAWFSLVALSAKVDTINRKHFFPAAGLQVDSISCANETYAAWEGGTVVIDKVTLMGQATSTAATAVLTVVRAGGVGRLLEWTKTQEYKFGAEEAVNTNWYTKVFDGPFACTADSPVVFMVYGTNTDSLSAVVNYHFGRE